MRYGSAGDLWHTVTVRTFFPDSTYTTPPDAASPVLRFLSRSVRWFFYAQYAAEVLYCKGLAERGVYDDAEWAESSMRVFRTIEKNGGRFSISGMDHLRAHAAEAPFIFVSNHMSTLETQIFPVLIVPFMPVTFVVKQSLMTHPFFSAVMRSRYPIAVRRKSPREDLETVLREGPQRLRSGMSVVVFPQSTRTSRFSSDAFNSLGVKLAASADVPLIPVAVKTDFWGERGLIRGFGPIRPGRTIYIEFGEPIRVEGRGRQEHRLVIDFIRSRLDGWQTDPGAKTGRQ